MEKKYRVLLVHNKYKLAGGEDTLAVNEMKLLREHGHTVIEYIKDNHDIDEMSAVQKLMVPLGLIYSRKTVRELDDIISKENIDVVHAINIVPLIGFSLYLWAKKRKLPLIQAVNNFRYVCPGGACMRGGKICEECIQKESFLPSIKYGCYRGSKLQTVCLCTALWIHKKIGTFEKVRYYVVPSGFNKTRLRSIVKNEKKIVVQVPSIPDGLNGGKIEKQRSYYVFAARLEKLKGIQVAIEAFKDLDVDLYVLGTGEDEQTMKDYVQEHDMSNVHFEGFKNYTEMREIFSKAKALLYPTQWYEGIPLTLLEAFAQGTPVIGSNIGNVNDCIEEGVNGYHFQYDSADSLREAVLKMEKNPAPELMYENARATYVNKYSEQEDYNRLMKLFRHVSRT